MEYSIRYNVYCLQISRKLIEWLQCSVHALCKTGPLSLYILTNQQTILLHSVYNMAVQSCHNVLFCAFSIFAFSKNLIVIGIQKSWACFQGLQISHVMVIETLFWKNEFHHSLMNIISSLVKMIHFCGLANVIDALTFKEPYLEN